MADDIDDLLDEFEVSLSHATTSTSVTNRTGNNTKSTIPSESVRTEDLKDLLADLDELPLPMPRPIILPRPKTECSKCSSPQLAGTSLPTGMSTGVTLRACDRLRCLKCDMPVLTMDGFCWSNAINYLFLRNNYPDMARLCARLEPHRVARAYACQCQHCSLTDPTTPANVGGLQWVCGGHPNT